MRRRRPRYSERGYDAYTLARTAYHEAGHTIARIDSDRIVTRVQLLPPENPDWLGVTCVAKGYSDPWDALRTMLAGAYAEARYIDCDPRELLEDRCCQSDMAHAKDAALELVCRGEAPSMKTALAIGHFEAGALVSERWRNIVTVAEILRVDGKLVTDELMELVAA